METIKTNSSSVYKTNLDSGISITSTENRTSESTKVGIRCQVVKNDVDAGTCYTSGGVYQLTCNLKPDLLSEPEVQAVMLAIIRDVAAIMNNK